MKTTTPIAAAAQPGDSVRDLFIPDRWVGHEYPLKGSGFHHPKKVTKNCQEMFYRYFSFPRDPITLSDDDWGV